MSCSAHVEEETRILRTSAFALLGSLLIKASHEMSVKLTPGPGVDPTKLFFFDNEEFFRFSLVSLRFRYIQKKIIDSKMT